jgi:hypothetical protein
MLHDAPDVRIHAVIVEENLEKPANRSFLLVATPNATSFLIGALVLWHQTDGSDLRQELDTTSHQEQLHNNHQSSGEGSYRIIEP